MGMHPTYAPWDAFCHAPARIGAFFLGQKVRMVSDSWESDYRRAAQRVACGSLDVENVHSSIGVFICCNVFGDIVGAQEVSCIPTTPYFPV